MMPNLSFGPSGPSDLDRLVFLLACYDRWGATASRPERAGERAEDRRAAPACDC